MVRVRCKSGLMGHQGLLRAEYENFSEFEHYSEMYGLAPRLGFKTARQAWDANPVIQSSVEPSDYRIAPSWIKQQNARLWVRLGDNCEYEEFGNDLDAVAEHLFSVGGVKGGIVACNGGIEAPGYENNGYISLFWGDKAANMFCNLTKAEVAQVKRLVKIAAK